MNEAQTALMMRGLFSQFPQEDRAKVEDAERRIREVIADVGEHAELAVGIIGAELVANQAAAEMGRPIPFPTRKNASGV